jgi:hypothetical protein
LYTATSQGSRDGITNVADAFLENGEHHPEDADKLPLIELASDSYVNSKGKRIFFPVFEILAWVERPAAVRHLRPPPVALLTLEADGKSGPKALPKRAGMDDEIPF